MKDFMFILGVLCWIGWFIDVFFDGARSYFVFSDKMSKVLQFCSFSLIVFSWYLV